jgi:glycosyltransferase involved in cell wall biosynthesis
VLFHPFFFFPEPWNGIDEHLLLLARSLDRDRYEMSVLVHDTDGAQTHVLAERAGIATIHAPYGAGTRSGRVFADLRALYARERIGILHLHSPSAAGLAVAAMAAVAAGVRSRVATFHLDQQRFENRTRSINRILFTWPLQQAIAVSNGVRQTLISNAGIPASRIVVVHNGVEPPPTPIGPAFLGERIPGHVRFAFFGRLSSEKGVEDLLRGLAIALPQLPTAVAFLVGDGPERSRLEAMTSDLGLTGRVRFLGFQPEARRLMDEVDIVVHVPRQEGLPMVILEAMAAGRALVVNNASPGVLEAVVDGVTAIVVPTGNADELARQLVALAGDQSLRRRMGDRARERCRDEFTAALMVRGVADVYERTWSDSRVGVASESRC